MTNGRISIEIWLPSVSVKRFVERTLADDDFFDHALENPFGAFREAGVNLEAEAFIPSDFARFFAALHRVREAIRAQGGKPTFEAIFGQPPRFSGAMLNAEFERGFFREWDMRDAVMNQLKCFSTAQNFEANRDRGQGATSVKDLCQTQEMREQFRLNIEMVGANTQSAETFRSQTREWDNADAVQNRRAETGTTRGFDKAGQRTLNDFLNGPLIYPEDLARLSERIDTVMDIALSDKK